MTRRTDEADVAAPPAWRGVAPEENEEVAASLSALLRERSRRLLGSLARPYKKAIVASAVLLLNNLASMAGPYLVAIGIDKGIPPLLAHEGAKILVTVTIVYLIATAVRVLAFG